MKNNNEKYSIYFVSESIYKNIKNEILNVLNNNNDVEFLDDEKTITFYLNDRTRQVLRKLIKGFYK